MHQVAEGFCSVLCARIEPVATACTSSWRAAGTRSRCCCNADESSRELGRLGTLLGVVEEPDLPEASIDLEPGDTVVFYTDGLTEAGAPDRLMRPPELGAIASPWAAWGADAVAGRLEAAALAAAGGELRDDLALVVLELPLPVAGDRIRAAMPTGPKLARSVRAAMEPLRDRLGRQTVRDGPAARRRARRQRRAPRHARPGRPGGAGGRLERARRPARRLRLGAGIRAAAQLVGARRAGRLGPARGRPARPPLGGGARPARHGVGGGAAVRSPSSAAAPRARGRRDGAFAGTPRQGARASCGRVRGGRCR